MVLIRNLTTYHVMASLPRVQKRTTVRKMKDFNKTVDSSWLLPSPRLQETRHRSFPGLIFIVLLFGAAAANAQTCGDSQCAIEAGECERCPQDCASTEDVQRSCPMRTRFAGKPLYRLDSALSPGHKTSLKSSASLRTPSFRLTALTGTGYSVADTMVSNNDV